MTVEDGREFYGYGPNPPNAHWPGGARVAVSLVLNIEEGAELTVSSGDERNESRHEIEQEIIGARDLTLESHFEFGSRVGYWRIMRLLDQYKAVSTFNVCARALERTPWLAKDAVARGHEMMCHGWRWEDHVHMSEDDERAVIKRCIASIRSTSGVRPVGWHVRGYPSVNTRRLLVEEGGFLYDSNAYNDELPYIVDVVGKAHVVVPYNFDTNDMRYFNGRGFFHADDFARYCIDAYDWLYEEGGTTPRMMTIGLHTRIIGRPGRIGGLRQFLDHVSGKGGAWFARRDEIAHHWRAVAGLPPFAAVS